MRTLFAAPPSSFALPVSLGIAGLLVLTLASPVGPAAARCVPFIPGVVTSSGGQVLLLPDGTGPTLEECGATITVQLWRCPGEPWALVGLPAQDVWLEPPETGNLAFCAPGAIADGPTDEQGITTISRALAGGGAASGQMLVYGGGSLFRVEGLQFVSPDLDGDLDVDLADVALFATDFRSGDPTGVGARSDFDFDGRLDLRDFAILAMALGTGCP